MDKDSYFIPVGYDSLSLLRNFDMNNQLAMLYEDKVAYVKAKNVIKEEEVVCEDINVFLKRYIDKGKKIESARKEEERGSERKIPVVNTFETEEGSNTPVTANYVSNETKPGHTYSQSRDWGKFSDIKKSIKGTSIDSGAIKGSTTEERLVLIN